MTKDTSIKRNRLFWALGLGTALVIAVFLSPFASSDPDGLDRVSKDLKFDHKAASEVPAKKLPFSAVFDEYSLRGVPKNLATPLAGLVGTIVTFGLAWGTGKLLGNISSKKQEDSETRGDF